MNAKGSTVQYALGSDDAELARLIWQAECVAPVTERLFREAGIGSGQRVLDLGSGPAEKSELSTRDAQGHIHRQRRKPNIDPIEKGDNVKKKNKRKNSDSHFLDRSGFDGRRTGVYFVAHGQAVWARALLGRSNTSVADMNNSTPATARPV